MPTWGEIGPELLKIQKRVANEPNPKVGPYDILWRKYLAKLHKRTGRATFLYYSGWMDKPNAGPEDLSVVGADVCGFMGPARMQRRRRTASATSSFTAPAATLTRPSRSVST